MPSNTHFCPRMTCETYDMSFAGLSQKLIGSFTLDLGHAAEEKAKDVEAQMAEMSTVVEQLGRVKREAEQNKAQNGKVKMNSWN